ncbi:MAG: circularly permuted type 2 ATP-grasp protein [Verrucomicrobiota bacterium JB022]|nr:circularly permuted type 2 ATP-grasp protein [Verrucomicrobiota bacterium JB022]
MRQSTVETLIKGVFTQVIDAQTNPNLLPWSACGEVAAAPGLYRPLLAGLEQFTPRTLRMRQTELDAATSELEAYAALHLDEGESVPALHGRLDLMPRLIGRAEWERLERGIVQRLQAFRLFTQDLLGPQRFLQDRVLSVDAIWSDPAFRVEWLGLPLPHNGPLTLSAIDLLPTGNGNWAVCDHWFSRPIGLGAILQHRRLLTQAVPELFDTVRVASVQPFADLLSETLAGLAEATPGREAGVILLGEGNHPVMQYEDSFLARHLGLPLVQPGDLLVRDGEVFWRTVQGLKPVQVIWRRLQSGSIDPVALGTDVAAGRGVAGLLHAVRQGSVQIVNAPGAGSSESRALLRYASRLVRYYLQEDPLLETVESFNLSDPDQALQVLDDPDAWLIQPLHDRVRPLEWPEGGPHSEEVRQWIAEMGRSLVAQRRPQMPSLPCFDGRDWNARHLALRVFALWTPNGPQLLPGGLSWEPDGYKNPGRPVVKDTWVEAPPEGLFPWRDEGIDVSTPIFNALGSRPAEAMYWIGRYLERSENTARMVRTLYEIPVGERGLTANKAESPELLRLIARLVSLPADLDQEVLLSNLLIDLQSPPSVSSCLLAAQGSARGIRERLSPEFWRALTAQVAMLDRFQDRKRLTPKVAGDICSSVVAGISRVFGTARRTLVHDVSWHFFSFGALLERTITNSLLLETILLPWLDGSRADQSHDRSELVVLLRLTSSLDAYHRENRVRALPRRVSRLLWQSEVLPHAVAYGLREMFTDLEAIQRTSLHAPVLSESLRSLQAEVAALEWGRGAGQGVEEVPVPPETLQRLLGLRPQIEALHQQLEDRYFSHQAPMAAYHPRYVV